MNKKFSLKLITASKDVQPRESINKEVIEHYADQMLDKQKFPPIVVFWDEKGDGKYWLSDGFHRFGALKKRGITEATIDLRKGTKRDAILFALGANAKHPLRLTNEEKRTAAQRMLVDEEWAQWSDVKIAEHIGVSRHLVGKMSSEMNLDRSSRKVERDGKEYDQKKPEPAPKPDPKPDLNPEPKPPEEPLTDAETERETEHLKNPDPPPATERTHFTIDDAKRLYRAGAVVRVTLTFLRQGMSAIKYRGMDSLDSLEKDIKDLMETFEGEGSEEIGKKEQNSIASFAADMKQWIKDGKKKKKTKEKEKEEYVPSKEALGLVKEWGKTIGMPRNPAPAIKYAKAFDDINRIDKQPWHIIEEVVIGIKQWQDKGIPTLSPLALRTKTRTGDGWKWEAAWAGYRASPDYKPLGRPPECPECGKDLVRGQVTRKGIHYSTYLCKDHPEKSLPLGQKFCPERRM